MRYLILTALILLSFLVADPAMSKELKPSRGLLVSVIQEPPVFNSHEQIKNLIRFAKKARIQTLYVQILRANTAWFPTEIADSQPYKSCFRNMSEDPFAYLLKESHRAGINVYAWLNILSLSENKNSRLLQKYGPSVLTRNLTPKKSLEDYKIDHQYFLEPGDLRVRREVANMLGDVLRSYPNLDGILLDYIRYPDPNPKYGYTQMNVERYKEMTGSKMVDEESSIWKDWKRVQVTEFLKLMVKKIRALRPKIKISATGCLPYARAYYEAFQDWPSWINENLVDSVTIMDYSTDVDAFERWIVNAKTKVSDFNRINIALGAYKSGTTLDIFAREYEICKASGGRSCIVFHYGSLINQPTLVDYLNHSKK